MPKSACYQALPSGNLELHLEKKGGCETNQQTTFSTHHLGGMLPVRTRLCSRDLGRTANATHYKTPQTSEKSAQTFDSRLCTHQNWNLPADSVPPKGFNFLSVGRYISSSGPTCFSLEGTNDAKIIPNEYCSIGRSVHGWRFRFCTGF